MEPKEDNYELPEDYWDNYEENADEYETSSDFNSRKLVDGISIKDLCDGKEVMFEIKNDRNEDINESDEELENIIHCDSKTMRDERGAPALSCSFEEIAENMTNVTENGFVKKQLITNGTGKVVSDQAYVTVHYNLYKRSCELPFDSTYLRNRPEKFRLDQGEAILGLEYAIKSMKKNENSRFFIKWEVAFGALGCPERIEPKCDIVADITLLNFVEVDPEQNLISLSESEIDKIDFTKFINQVKQLLCNGSEEFCKGNDKTAVVCYRKALRILNRLRLADEDQESQMLKQKVKCLVNLSVCYNKQGKPEKACIACQEALSIDQNSVKANFHYGRANLALSNFVIAQKYLLRADKLKPNDKDINREIKKLNDKKALYEMKDKIFWKKAFEGEEEIKTTEEEIKTAEEEIKTAEEVDPSPLNSFEKNLITSLEECIKEKKSHIIPLPLLDDEMRVCDKVAAQMKMAFEKHADFCIFKKS